MVRWAEPSDHPCQMPCFWLGRYFAFPSVGVNEAQLAQSERPQNVRARDKTGVQDRREYCTLGASQRCQPKDHLSFIHYYHMLFLLQLSSSYVSLNHRC